MNEPLTKIEAQQRAHPACRACGGRGFHYLQDEEMWNDAEWTPCDCTDHPPTNPAAR